MTRSIVNKIAHGPISELRKQAGDPEGATGDQRHPPRIPIAGAPAGRGRFEVVSFQEPWEKKC